MNEVLMQAIVEFAAFLELSDDDIIDPDVAVEQLEQLSSILKGLSPSERDLFRNYVQRLAASERIRSGEGGRLGFLMALTENLCL